MKKSQKPKITRDEIQNCISVLENLIQDSEQLMDLTEEQRISLLAAAGRLSRPDREELKKRRKDKQKRKRKEATEQERAARAATGIRRARTEKVFQAPEQLTSGKKDIAREEKVLKSPRNCYICKAEFVQLHFFYDALCPKCADFNYNKR